MTTPVILIGGDRRSLCGCPPIGLCRAKRQRAQGVVVLPSAVVHTRAKIGEFAVINTGSIIEHDVVIGRHAIIGPGVIVGGGTIGGDGAAVGLRGAIRDNIRIGNRAVVAIGAVIVRDVAPGETAFGVGLPATYANEVDG